MARRTPSQLRSNAIVRLILLILLSTRLASSGLAGPDPSSDDASTDDNDSPSSLAVQAEQESVALEPGKPIEREISRGQKHNYETVLSEGQFINVVVTQ